MSLKQQSDSLGNPVILSLPQSRMKRWISVFTQIDPVRV